MAQTNTAGAPIVPPPVLLGSSKPPPTDAKQLEKLVDSMAARKEADMTKFAVLQDLMDRIVSEVQECRDSLHKSVHIDKSSVSDKTRKCCEASADSKHPQGWRK
jgi:hypothetical protein